MQASNDMLPENEGSDEESANADRLMENEAFRRMMKPLTDQFAEIIQPYTAEVTRSLAERMTFLAEEFRQGLASRSTAINEAFGTSAWPQQMLESLKPAIAHWSASVAPMLEQVRTLVHDHLPSNWHGAELNREKIEDILVSDGIPLAWVPRAEIVSLLMHGSSRQERIKLLMDRRAQIRRDCQECLNVVEDPDLSEWVSLAYKAIAAWESGHDEAAQALATVTAESVITRRIAKPRDAADMAASSWETLTLGRAKLAIALGPLVGFYQTWRPDEGRPPLATLSRHVTVHHPSAVQVNPENCMMAVMLLCSILRTLHEVTIDGRAV